MTDTKIILKKSNVPDNAPTGTQLDIGEVALNFPDRKVFTKAPDGSIVELGSQDEVDLQLARFDTDAGLEPTEGQLTWNADWGTLEQGMNGGGVTYLLGQQELLYVRNTSGATMAKGTVAMATGTIGQSSRITAAPMIADGSVDPKFILGIVSESIPNGEDGYVTIVGLIRQLDTTAFAQSDVLWADPATPGGLTATKPQAPNLKLPIAIVVNSHVSVGALYVRITEGSDLSEDHRVELSSPQDGQALIWDAANGRFENKTIPGAITYTAGDGLAEISGEFSVDSTVVRTNDSRLTDAREWTASTVSQIEAETGTATTRRAWTAQRVRQAILGWWNGSGDKAKLDGIEAGAQVNVATNLGYTAATTTGTVTSSTGSNATVPAATTSAAGLMTSTDKSKLNGIEAGAQVNVATNLGQSRNATSYTVTSSTGSNTTLAAATTTLAGVLTSTDKSKLDGIEAGAQVNVATDLGSSGTGATRTITSSTGADTSITYSAADLGAVPTGRLVSTSGIATGGGDLSANRTINVPGTNLAMGGSGDSRTVTSSTGNNVSVPVVTTTNAGFMSTTDKSKLDGIAAGAQVNVATNLGQSRNATSYTVTSSTGSNTTLAAATTTNAGVFVATDKAKLDGIAAGAQVNVATNLGYTSAASNGVVTSSTGTNATVPAATTSIAGLLTSADKTKLDGVATGATANTGTVTSVAASAGTGISVSGSPITTSGTLTITNTAPHQATNLGITGTGDTRTITSSTGTNVTVPVATTTTAGWLSTADKSKLDGVQAGAQVNVGTNLGSSGTGGTRTITSSTGSDTSITFTTTDLGAVPTGRLVSTSGIATGGGDLSANRTINVPGTNIAQGTRTATSVPITSSTGSNGALDIATTTLAGVMSSADKTKLDGIQAGAQVNVATNLTYTAAASSGTVNSSTGSNATVPAATTTLAGLLTSTDKTKLDGIAAGAQVNVGTNLGNTVNATSVTVTSSTGSNTTLASATTTNAGVFAAADKLKLDGVQAGAQVNVGTNLGQSRNATSYTVTSSTGSNTALAEATTTLAGVFSAADKTKLNGIQAGAQVNVGTNLSITNGTTAGPTINSSTGSNVTFPTASATISGAITTGAQTFAGNKTFNGTVTANSFVGDGSGLTNLPAGAPTTEQVLSAIAGASVGAVGTYAFLAENQSSSPAFTGPGTNRAGSTLRYVSAATDPGTSFQVNVGTWKCMGYSQRNAGFFTSRTTVWLRIV
jgi:hypothetical protein